jgi:hypothetical protein
MYKTINGWTKKEVVSVLEKRKHKGKSFNPITGRCEYRMSNGNKCGIGMFIPRNHEGLYSDMGVDHLLEEYPDLKTKLPFTLKGLTALQEIHDFFDWDDVKTEMIEWAKKNVRD